MEVIPKKEWNKDDLAGGMYCPIGLGSIPPGPKLQVRNSGRHQELVVVVDRVVEGAQGTRFPF